MAIDFPSNPTNGQVYANYIYDSSITAWRNVNTDTGIGTLNAMGLKNVVPTSVTVSAGSATINGNGTVSFSAATDLNLRNIFTSTYKNYKIIISWANSSGSETAGWFSSSGTNITTGWYGASWYTNYGGATGAANLRTNGNGGWIGYSNTEPTNSSLDVYIDTTNSKVQYNLISYSKAAASMNSGGYGTSGTADGFRVSPLTGGTTMTGTLQVFGYNQ